MEEGNKKRGRPRINTELTDASTSSRRAATNWKYVFDGVEIVKQYSNEIPDSNLIWFSNEETQSAKARHGILEQIGRMYVQDRTNVKDCVTVAQCATAAVKAGHTTREIEKAIRALRKAIKEFDASDKDPKAEAEMNNAYYALCDLGGPQ